MTFAQIRSFLNCRTPKRCAANVFVLLLVFGWMVPAPREWLMEHLRRMTGNPAAIGPWRDWDKPTEPRELEAYNFAHSIKLPDSLPKPVPFNFLRYWYLDHGRVSYEYFQHLCNTEAGEYIFKTIDKVEGIYQMRPMPKRTEALMKDRYGFEDPADWSQREADGSPTVFIGSGDNGFLFLESPRAPEDIVNAVYLKRWTILRKEAGGGSLLWRYSGYDGYTGQGMIGELTDKRRARYGYTWRGIIRERDREHGISGGELMVVNLQSGELLAVRRTFALAKIHTAVGLNWEFSRYCPGSLDYVYGKKRSVNKIVYPFDFIRQVLVPINFSPRNKASG